MIPSAQLLEPPAVRDQLLRTGPEVVERRRTRRVTIAWGLLVLNVTTFYGEMPRILPIPGVVGTLITQSALLGALVLVLTVNRPLAIRPSVFMVLLTLLPVEALMICFRAEFLAGAVYRAGRLSVFVLILWLLSPWWDRPGLPLFKAHLTALWVVLGSLALGLIVAPGTAMESGRLSGVVWPIPATQAAHYGAVAVGLAIVLWFAGALRKELALLAVVVGTPLLLLTHTRTALGALVAGLAVAGLSLFVGHARVRRAFAAGFVVVAIGALTVSSLVTTWLARGQDADQVGELTGRTQVWNAVLAQPRTTFETLFGFGLSNKSFNGLPIDSNWLATYYDLGLAGAAVNALLLLFVLVAAWFRPQGPRRALALFLVTYCIVASFTETGLSDASNYFLEMTLAASLIVSPAPRRSTA